MGADSVMLSTEKVQGTQRRITAASMCDSGRRLIPSSIHHIHRCHKLRFQLSPG